MRIASLALVVVALASSGALAACAADAPADIAPVADDGGTGVDAKTSPTTGKDSGTTTPEVDSGPQPGVCIGTCTNDNECQSTCPAQSSGTYCCDTATGSCYVSQDPQCPAAGPDGGPVQPY